MSRPDLTKVLKIIGIASLAAAVGAVIALLLAPKSGQAMRADIYNRIREKKTKLTNKQN